MTTRTLYDGTTEYLDVSVTADVQLDAQPVAISFDRNTWHTAAWTGVAGTTRTARLLLDDTTLPDPGSHPVYVRITDTPEAPVLNAGSIYVI